LITDYNYYLDDMKKILFILKNENEPSGRFRAKAYFPYLKDFEIDIFYSEYHNQHMPKALRSIIKRARYLFLLKKAKKADRIFMQRPMSRDSKSGIFFEWLLSKINQNIIFDFDDAIHLVNQKKMARLIGISKRIICSNENLLDFTRQHHSDAIVIPTVIDTEKFNAKKDKVPKDKITIGWTGTSGNYQFFSDQLLAELEKIINKYASKVEFLFICDKKPPEHFRFPYIFSRWHKKTEAKDLQKIDIGIMPLFDNEWARGKAGFKLIQYGAIGIPSVASNVGVNDQIILHGKTGYLVNGNEEDWGKYLECLINDEQQRKSFGNLARKHIEENYSISSQYDKYISILRK